MDFKESSPKMFSTFHICRSSTLYIYLSWNPEFKFPKTNWSGPLKSLQVSSPYLQELPDSIGNIRSLEILDLSHSNLRRPTPVSLGNLTQLEYLDLSHNNLSGPIPWSVFNLTHVQFLDFSENKLEGSLPSQVSGLSQLSILLLDHNFLSGRVPTWLFSLPSLVKLRLNNNKLNGNFELDKLSECSKLEQLSLSDNALSSFTSASNANYSLPNLVSLELSSCNISEFPNFNSCPREEDMFLKLKNLKTLDLHKSPLSVSDNSNPSFVLPHLDTLWLSSCNITKFSNFLTMQESLTYLDISNNSIQDLAHNNLSGVIPKCLGLRNIFILDLEMNRFHGNIPDFCVEENHRLQTLNLNNNDFDGLPKSLANCVDLEVLNLGNNKINDIFPHWLGNLPRLQVLVLRSNYFHGQITHFENESHFSTLRILDLSHNKFSGFLPTTYFTSFQGMMSLADVQMGYIGAEDTYYRVSVVVTMKAVDIELEKILTVFAAIDMSSNKFEGTIPETVGNLISLQVLNFSHNHLAGHIPSSLGNLEALESLDLSCNKLVREIPSELTGLNFLEVLNLSENQLVGLIPQGKQINTFLNDSYVGNTGLCGFPVSKSCGRSDPPPAIFDEEVVDSAFGLDWKFAMMGYGCGLVSGFSAGYIMMTIRKPKWLVGMIQRAGNRFFRRIKKNRTNCCLWDGVRCDNETGNVITLDLSFSCLHPLPSPPSPHLNLARNDFNMSPIAPQFSCKIPNPISHLSKLLSLDLSDNYNLIFEGQVFENVVKNLTQLRHFHLSNIDMSSVAATSFINMSSYITTLILENNKLQGKFPEDVFHFPYLQKFYSIYLPLESRLEQELELKFPKTNWSGPLKSLQASSPYLQELPDSIGNLRSLEILDLGRSHLKGPIPASFGNLTQLEYLDLSYNNFSGPIPCSFLDLSENNLVGSLPSKVSGLSQLGILRLHHNFLSGRVPSWLVTLPSLVEVRFNNNKLNGNFGLDKLSELSKLEHLSLSYNAFSSFTSASNTNHSLPNLVSLELSSCNISEFPNFVRNLEGLHFLNLSCNRIHVIEADMFLKLKSLETLDLSHNNPLSVGNNSEVDLVLPILNSLLLSSCNITELSNF
ncbi:receptor-like protein 12 [Gossypium australe]|uniref:Receptor-like protein 12 n=1 Tax=Gossypium australe TaxID=47621 RepID=A0A5B6VFB3_9ROSI|nr:receptor-like protein 12 [Gossypium australe]